MKITNIFLLSCIIFAVLFGAGNLIVPTTLGYESTVNLLPAISGFLLTDVLLTIIGIIAFVSIKGNVEEITDKIGKRFTLIYMYILEILIGPAFVIPRTAVVSYELAIDPFINSNNNKTLILLIFAFIYFFITLVCCLYSSKSIQFISKYIIPILLLIIIAIIIGAILWPISSNTNTMPQYNYKNSPFVAGMLKGYLTMDTLCSITIVSIIINKLKDMNITNHNSIIKNTILASIISGIILSSIYIGLSYIGFTSDSTKKWANGGTILVQSIIHSFGNISTIAIIFAFIIACFTSAVTLTIGFSEYFDSRFNKLKYKQIVVICVLISFLFSTLGFNSLMNIFTPILNIVYPIIIVIIGLTIFKNHVNNITAKTSVTITIILNLIYIFYNDFYIHNNSFINFFINFIPLFKDGIGWLLPTIIISILVQLFTNRYKNKNFN